MNGAESLLRTLVGSGVEVCFSNPGTSEMHFVAALDRVERMRVVLGLFEGAVTGMVLWPHGGEAGFAQQSRLGRNGISCCAQGFGRGAPVGDAYRGRASGWFDSSDVGGVADQVTAWLRRPIVCRSPESNSGGNGQSAETADHREGGETVCENLAGRRCPIERSDGYWCFP